jgi:hypothetical protein
MAALRRVLTDPAFRAELRERSLARAREFSWELTARRHLAAYEEASDRFRVTRRKNHRPREAMTRYREKMRHWTVEKSVDYIWQGTRITQWPF